METSSRKIKQKLEADGFILISVKGSHQKFRKENRVVILPHPKKDLPLGTVRQIYKQAGWL